MRSVLKHFLFVRHDSGARDVVELSEAAATMVRERYVSLKGNWPLETVHGDLVHINFSKVTLYRVVTQNTTKKSPNPFNDDEVYDDVMH
jgi:hypothetical protein